MLPVDVAVSATVAWAMTRAMPLIRTRHEKIAGGDVGDPVARCPPREPGQHLQTVLDPDRPDEPRARKEYPPRQPLVLSGQTVDGQFWQQRVWFLLPPVDAGRSCFSHDRESIMPAERKKMPGQHLS